MSIIRYIRKLKKIEKNPYAEEYFCPAEIIGTMVNLIDAKKSLSRDEFVSVNTVFQIFKGFKKQILLNGEGYLRLCDNIIAHFDLIAPYYKFCGNRKYGSLSRIFDGKKSQYRKTAKKLIEERKLFAEEWMELHESFLAEFYS